MRGHGKNTKQTVSDKFYKTKLYMDSDDSHNVMYPFALHVPDWCAQQDVVYAAVLDAILLLIIVLVGFFRYSSKVKALSNALERPVRNRHSFRKQQMMWRYLSSAAGKSKYCKK